jgi:hypothetical protein
MEFKFKFIAALIAVMLAFVPGMVAQNPDVSQNPAPSAQDQMAPDQTAPSLDQDPNSDQDIMDSQGGQSSVQQDQNDRPPMSELPPKPSPSLRYPAPPSTPSSQGNYDNYNNASGNQGVARISLIHGNVSTQRGDSSEWSAAQLNAPLVTGDRISTGDQARTELQLDYANILRLAEHTQANISNLTRSQIQIQVGHGMANYTVLRNSDTDAEIDTPNVAIRTERRDSSFRILVTADDHTEVLVRRGEVEITTPQGGTRVGENQFITIRGMGDQTQYRIGEAPARDDWDQWNSDRDHLIHNSISRSRTNDYYVGSQDLDAYGSWRDVPDYGSVWVPSVDAGWAPYRAGQWVWEPYWGWTWVSYDPWGWAPYHYGRWFMYDGAWAWWPGPVYPYYRPVWAPAYVSFFGWGGGFGVGFGWGSVGWFPIGPCDRFYPWWGSWRGRFGVTNINIYNTRGGFAPLHGGNRFSNVRLAMNDPHFRGASSVRGGEFGRGRAGFQPVNRSFMTNAHFATGNLPVVPNRGNLSASGRPAARDTLHNSGGNQRFFSTRGNVGVTSRGSFEREQSQISNAMRQRGTSPFNGQGGGFGDRNESRLSSGDFRNNAIRNEGAAGGNHDGMRPNQTGSNDGFRQFNSPSGPANQSSRPSPETRGNSNWGSVPRPGGPENSGREGGGSNGGWQKFSPMSPRPSSPSSEPANRGSFGGSENRGYNGGGQSRGSYPSPSESRGYSRYPGSQDRGYGGGSRPALNMRQPIVTPRSYGGGYPGGARSAPSYGGRPAPSFGGGHSSPSFGGGRPSSGGAPHGGSAPRGGSASHGGGGSSHSGGSRGGRH